MRGEGDSFMYFQIKEKKVQGRGENPNFIYFPFKEKAQNEKKKERNKQEKCKNKTQSPSLATLKHGTQVLAPLRRNLP